MSNESEQRIQRLEMIRQILQAEEVTSQGELVAALEKHGIRTTQSAVSRDLRELSVAKVAGRYLVASPSPQERPPESLPGFILGIDAAGPNLLVVHTVIGGANRVALAVDRAGWSGALGTVAGNDTVVVATRGARQQRDIQRRLWRLAPHL